MVTSRFLLQGALKEGSIASSHVCTWNHDMPQRESELFYTGSTVSKRPWEDQTYAEENCCLEKFWVCVLFPFVSVNHAQLPRAELDLFSHEDKHRGAVGHSLARSCVHPLYPKEWGIHRQHLGWWSVEWLSWRDSQYGWDSHLQLSMWIQERSL